MNENISKAVDFAFSNNISEMGKEIENALMQKVSDALAGKRIEVAQTLVQNEREEPVDDFEDEDFEESESIQELSKETLQSYVNKRQWDMGANEKAQKKMDTGLARAETKLKGDQHKLDKNKNGKLDSQDFKLLRKESEELEEKLSVSDGAEKWIHDFVHSDNPKFEGKSKKERIQMALGAFYAAKKATNEEVEELDEISSKLAYRAASKRGERMSKAWRANDMDTFEKERGKAEKTYNIATKKAKAAEKKNPQKPEQSYPLGGYSRASNRSYSEEIEDIQELSKETLQNYVNKRQWDMGANEKAQKKMDTGLARAEKKIKRKLKISQ
jgi:hypothetical protein